MYKTFVDNTIKEFQYDHEEEKMAQKMEKLEIKILKKLDIENPYK